MHTNIKSRWSFNFQSDDSSTEADTDLNKTGDFKIEELAAVFLTSY